MDSKEDAASRMSLFLQIIFSAIKTTEIALATTTNGRVVLIDQINGHQKIYEAKEIDEMYNKYINDKTK